MEQFGWGMFVGLMLGLGIGYVIVWAQACEHRQPGGYSGTENPPPDARPTLRSGVPPKPPQEVNVTLNIQGVTDVEEWKRARHQVAADMARILRVAEKRQ